MRCVLDACLCTRKTPNFHGIVWNHEKLFHHIQLKPFGAFLTPGGLPNKSQVWPVTTLQDLVNPRRDRRLWWRERDRALAAHFFWSLCRACLGFCWRQGWIAHLGDDDYLVKTTLRFLWSTRICRDSIFNVLSTKSCPVGRLWWLERLNMCQSSLYLWF